MGSLKTFIKDVRGAKTLAEERATITKESAKIRTKLKDDHISSERRRKYIQKLLYLYILGEKTHFAQVECINLIASDNFADKRLGYLAAILLLDEDQELLTLLTNLLNNDLNNPLRYVVSLALNALGTLTSPELARDLYADVVNILEHSRDPYLLKKALFCAGKLVSRDPSLLEVFTPFASKIARNREICTHGVLLGLNKLIQSVVLSSSSYEFENLSSIVSPVMDLVPDLLSTLKSLNSSTMNPQFDVNGICDPFLQVELLYSLRVMFQNFPSETEKHKDSFVDILTQVATYTSSSTNSSFSILYEAVRTIFSLQFDHSLRVLGVNILANFLSGKDSNTRYVALNSLLSVVSFEPSAVQRHRKFISSCMFDPDISIRMRALELIFAIINDSNMKELIDELILFLQRSGESERNMILYCVTQLIDFFEMHEIEDERWKLNAMTKVIKYASEYIPAEKIGETLIMINNTEDLDHKREVILEIIKLALSPSIRDGCEEHLALKILTVWSIGEYGDLVLDYESINATVLTDYLYYANGSLIENAVAIGYILSAALKLSVKIQDKSSIERLRQLIKSHTQSRNVAIQSKSVQYSVLFNQPASVKLALLEPMPVYTRSLDLTSKGKNQQSQAPQSKAKTSKEDFLLDLLGDVQTVSETGQKKTPTVTNDLLNDLFGDSIAKKSESSPTIKISAARSPTKIPDDSIEMYSSDFVDVFGRVVSTQDNHADIDLFVKSKVDINGLQLLIAVSKSQKVQIGPLPSHQIKKGNIAKQSLKIIGSGKLKLRIKLSFNSTQEQFDFKFDQAL